ncbi:MAG: glycosyltransferase, partial [Gammaproteobacteria bacterium]
HMGRCIQALGCPEEKIQVQHLGIAIDEIPFAPYPWRPGESLKVLMAASFREKKGIPLALQALAHLRLRNPVEITLIGDAGSEPRAQAEKARILDVIDRNNLTDAVRMMGYQPHSRMLTEAKRHHIFLSPSLTASDGDTEGGAPVSLIEMSAVGMMVISATHCDIPEVVIDGETGLLAPEGDLDGLVGRLDWAIDHWHDWEAIRKAARKNVEELFDARLQAEKLAGIYRALLK